MNVASHMQVDRVQAVAASNMQPSRPACAENLFGDVAGAEVGGSVAAVAVAEPAASFGGGRFGLRHQPAALSRRQHAFKH